MSVLDTVAAWVYDLTGEVYSNADLYLLGGVVVGACLCWWLSGVLLRLLTDDYLDSLERRTMQTHAASWGRLSTFHLLPGWWVIDERWVIVQWGWWWLELDRQPEGEAAWSDTVRAAGWEQ